jgi:hypothetical protein
VTNSEVLRSRFERLSQEIQQACPDADMGTLQMGVLCNGCKQVFEYPATDFSFWRLGDFRFGVLAITVPTKTTVLPVGRKKPAFCKAGFRRWCA